MSVGDLIIQKCQSFENGNKRRTAIIYALTSQFFFITMYTCVGILRTSYSMYQVILGRCVIGYLITLSQCKSFNIKIFYSNKIVFRLLVISGILVAVKTVCLFMSYKYLNISDGFIISNTNPIWTTFLASYFLHEKITFRKLLSSLVSFLGIILVVRPSFLFEPTDIKSLNLPSNLERNQTLGCALGLTGSVLISFITIIMRKLQDQFKCPSAAQLIYSFYATVVVSALCLIQSPTQFEPSFDFFFYTLIISVCGYLAEFFFSRSFAFEEASIISPLQYTEIVLSFGIDVFVFNEKIFFTSIFGSILVVVGSLATIFQ